jgi:hypothetical protein
MREHQHEFDRTAFPNGDFANVGDGRTNPMTEIHIVFGSSAAGELRRGLTMAGRSDRVFALDDDLSFGPIDPPDIATRAGWVQEALGYSDWGSLKHELEEFWASALADHPNPIVWVSRKCAFEFCGFLEWLHRRGDKPCSVVDLTDAVVQLDEASGQSESVRCTGLVTGAQFAGAQLWGRARPLDAETRSVWAALWTRLRRENAALRVLEPEGLRSVELDWFDERILIHVDEDWNKAARSVGRFLGEAFEPPGFFQTGDMLPISRLAALAAAGRIEARGDPFNIQTCSIRRAR